MEKETVLAKIRSTLNFSKETLLWFNEIQNKKVTFVELAEMPLEVKFPNHLKNKIHYSDGLLHFKGVLSVEEKNELQGLSQDISYMAAIGGLFESSQLWFAREGGNLFLSEFRGTWEKTLVSSTEPIIHNYFLELGLHKENLPSVKVYESYPGSWITDAAITMSCSIGTAYVILKGISELPKIADS